MNTRIYFLDNLRTFMIFLVVVIHAGIVYETILENIWIVSDPVKNSSIGLVRMYLDLFVMFILFFVSGYFVPGSLKSKTTRGFITSKFKRIFLPWIIAVLTLIPAYKAIFLYSRGLPGEEWYSYFHFFQRSGTDMGFFSNNPSQSWLWFLPVLFLFQLLYAALSKLNLLSFKISLRTGIALTFIIGLIYSMIISTTGLTGWTLTPIFDFQRERLLVYFMVFLLGSLCYNLNAFESTTKNRKFYILSNVALTILLGIFTAFALNLFFNIVSPGRNHFFISGPIDRLVYYMSMLLSMLTFIYILTYVFRFNFNKANKLMSHLNKNSYAVYIIHVVVMGILALGLVNIPIPAVIKYMILTILTFVFSNLIVYATDRLFQKSVSLQVATFAIPVVAIFTLINTGIHGESTTGNMEDISSQPAFTLPQMGLHEAVIRGNVEAIQTHIEVGADLDERELSGGSSPLITAAVLGKTEIATILINAGADVDFQNYDGSTPLHSAAFFCRREIVEALLSVGADKDIKNNSGSTALESVSGPFGEVKGIYEYFANSLGPLGLVLDFEQLQQTRPIIAEILRNDTR